MGAIASSNLLPALRALAAAPWLVAAEPTGIGLRGALLLAAALGFVLFLALKMRPRLGTLVRRAGAISPVRDRRLVRRWSEAMDAEPTSPEPVAQAVAAAKRRRGRALERCLWQRLGELPWDEKHRAALRATADGLAELSERKRPAEAAALRKLAAQAFSRPIR